MKTKFYKISGYKTYFSRCWGRGTCVTNTYMTIYAPISAYEQEKGLNVGDEYDTMGGFYINADTLTMSGYKLSICIDKVSVCNDTEIEIINNVLAKYNLRYITFQRNKTFRNGTSKVQEWDGLQYISKDNLIININGKQIKYKDINKEEINGKIVLSWDNGYSFYGSETTDKGIDYLVEKLFQDFNDKSVFGNGRAFCGETYGWQFNEFYQPVIRLSQKDINYSVVSNT